MPPLKQFRGLPKAPYVIPFGSVVFCSGFILTVPNKDMWEGLSRGFGYRIKSGGCRVWGFAGSEGFLPLALEAVPWGPQGAFAFSEIRRVIASAPGTMLMVEGRVEICCGR